MGDPKAETLADGDRACSIATSNWFNGFYIPKDQAGFIDGYISDVFPAFRGSIFYKHETCLVFEANSSDFKHIGYVIMYI